MMKSKRLLFFALILSLASLFASPAAFALPAPVGNVYTISTAAELFEVAALSNSENSPFHSKTVIRLASDIDLNNQAWTPIGAYGYYWSNHGYIHWASGFKGEIDGDGHTVSGLKVTTSSVKRSDKGVYKGIYYVGFAGTGRVHNLTVEGTVNATSLRGPVFAGGIVGRGSAYNCVSRVTVTASSGSESIPNSSPTRYKTFPAYVGGVVGTGGARNCVADGAAAVSGSAARYTYTGSSGNTVHYGGAAFVGGIVGGGWGIYYNEVFSGSASYCSYEGVSISASGNTVYAGGISAASTSYPDNCSIVNPSISASGNNADNSYSGQIMGRILDTNNTKTFLDWYKKSSTVAVNHNAIVNAYDGNVVGAGINKDGRGGALIGPDYYNARGSSADLQPVILQMESPHTLANPAEIVGLSNMCYT